MAFGHIPSLADFHLGQLVPDDSEKIFDADYCIAGNVLDAKEGKHSFMNANLVKEAFPALWEDLSAKIGDTKPIATSSPNDSGNPDTSITSV